MCFICELLFKLIKLQKRFLLKFTWSLKLKKKNQLGFARLKNYKQNLYLKI